MSSVTVVIRLPISWTSKDPGVTIRYDTIRYDGLINVRLTADE